MPTDYHFESQYVNFLTEQLLSHFFTGTETHSTATSQSQISVIQSHNQQQPIVPIDTNLSHWPDEDHCASWCSLQRTRVGLFINQCPK